MFIGGTNFGFMNGANYGAHLQPQPTSYDYDAPLTEAGDMKKKYFLIQHVVAKYNAIPPGPQPTPTMKTAYGKIAIKKTVSLYSLLPRLQSMVHKRPLSFEQMDIPYGYVLYRTTINLTG